MKTSIANSWTVPAGAALAALVSLGLLHGCAYDNDWVQINDGATTTTSASITVMLHAKDDSRVDAYLVMEVAPTDSPAKPAASDANWHSITAPSNVFDGQIPFMLANAPGDTVPAQGAKTIYAWFKNGFGNVSDPVSDTVTYSNTSGGGGPAPGY